MSQGLLSDAIEEYLAYRLVTCSPNTARASGSSLRNFLLVVGNIRTKSLGPEHGERYQSWMAGKGYSPATINLWLGQLSQFSKWATARRMLRPGMHLTGTTRFVRDPKRPRMRVPQRDFARLLDAARRPDVRMLIALGLYLFLRAGEACRIRLSDVNLDAGTVQVFVQKTSMYDSMPICEELDGEIRRWLTSYAEDIRDKHGPLQPNHYLIPAMPNGGWYLADLPLGRLDPTRPMQQPARFVNRTLVSAGYRITDENGKPTREGMHTLRRSGARAYFDAMLASGDIRDGVLRQVSAMLHHQSVTITERYLGLEADREKRDMHLRGRRMFPAADTTNVVALPKAAVL